MIKVYGVLCGGCAGCQFGGTLENGKYITSCKILATEVENTQDVADQCNAFVADPIDKQKVWQEG